MNFLKIKSDRISAECGFKDVNCFTAALGKFEKVRSPKTSSTIFNQLLIRRNHPRSHH
ncbi:hypothetical protein [Oscillatoria nigro-viridis]|uniref:hypothetical protein n=1 Tax=Phormidium nigroviride TaxID=482564 RepID=UPI00167F8666|nr:hypothetical protein [Oscillatoria nigro-viridis]